MKTILFLLILTLSLAACSKISWKSFEPAELKQRRTGLYAEDFAGQHKGFETGNGKPCRHINALKALADTSRV